MADLLPQDAALVLRAEQIERDVTPGPWLWDGNAIEGCRPMPVIHGHDWDIAEPDARFIAASRSLLPELRERVRVLSQQVARVEWMIAKYEAWEGAPSPIGPLHGAGMAEAVRQAAKDFKAALGAALEVGGK